MGDRIGKMLRRRAEEEGRSAAWMALWDAQSILDKALDGDHEMTLEMMDDCRNLIISARSYFDKDD